MQGMHRRHRTHLSNRAICAKYKSQKTRGAVELWMLYTAHARTSKTKAEVQMEETLEHRYDSSKVNSCYVVTLL